MGSLDDRELVFATYLAPCIAPVYEFVATTVGEKLDRPTRLIVGESFDQVRNAEVDFAFLCGLPYVRLKRENPEAVEAIAAPIIQGERYEKRPVYFSDVIVPARSPAAAFEDLRGRSWAYNEPDSHSGYLITLSTLVEMDETPQFFERWEMTGFHQESIRLVAADRIEGSAVDSQVLGIELRDHPELAGRIRVIGTLGPSTIQPLVATAAVPPGLRHEVIEIIAGLGSIESERRSLSAGMVDRFVAIDDSAYGDIRSKLKAVEEAGYLQA
ncbi:MAG TPA: PhnD/SsuA/transferrin family substrate-binding protein [Candidatus Dormibacteraeota bacterium]